MPRAKKGQQKVQNLKRRHGFAPLGVITLWCNVCISNMSSYSFFMNTSSLTMLRTDDNTGYMKGIQFFFWGGEELGVMPRTVHQYHREKL